MTMPNTDILHQAQEIFRAKVERARRMSADEKFLADYRLFRQGCVMMESGIRDQFPDADDAEVQRQLRYRLKLARRLQSGKQERIHEMIRGAG